jgi:hypothetical protein
MVNILPSFYPETYLTPMGDCLNATLSPFGKPVAARRRRWTGNGFISLVRRAGFATLWMSTKIIVVAVVTRSSLSSGNPSVADELDDT